MKIYKINEKTLNNLKNIKINQMFEKNLENTSKIIELVKNHEKLRKLFRKTQIYNYFVSVAKLDTATTKALSRLQKACVKAEKV